MSELENFKLLCDMIKSLQTVNLSETTRVSSIRELIVQINDTKGKVLDGTLELSSEDLAKYQLAVDNAVSGNDIDLMINVETTNTIEMFQLGVSSDNVNLEFSNNSTIPPEHGSIIQKLWEVKFKDNTTGHVIVTDTSDEELSTLLNAQLSTILATTPSGAVEDLDITLSVSDLKDAIVTNSSSDLSNLFVGFEKPGLVSRQLRDIDIDNDPALSGFDQGHKTAIQNAVNELNSASTAQAKETAQANLQTKAETAGLYSTSLGPHANFEYSDLKRFKLQKEDSTIVTVVASMPVISWGSPVTGIHLRNSEGPLNKTNRKDSGTSYVVDLGGQDPAIRNGTPNPLPPTKFFNNGPSLATENEGALERYAGGKCLGLNTTDSPVTFEARHRENDGDIIITVPPMSALWKLDRATFNGGNKHAYYTVFSASRPPASGNTGTVLAPKQGRLGRGRGEIASGVTLANGVSKTGKTFNEQDASGALLDAGVAEVPSGLKGVTSDYDGHGLHPVDLLKFMEDNDFVKGSEYLTIPANATTETVEDVLIPAGQFIPQITQALGTLIQFANGTFIQDGGPSRFQPGLIPFLPGTPSYTPEWHIQWITFNCGEVLSDGTKYPVDDPAADTPFEEWTKPGQNASFGTPVPNPNNTRESGFSPAFPDTFDPVQLRAGIKFNNCREYVDKLPGSKHGEITLGMLTALQRDNKLLITDAPAGAQRGWVKFLVVNCPLPVIVTTQIIGEEIFVPPPTEPEVSGTCITCDCGREATTVSINGAEQTIWNVETKELDDIAIGPTGLKFTVGDRVVIRATTGTVHGVSLRMDNMVAHTAADNIKTLAEMQDEVLLEIKDKITINNENALENHQFALSDELIGFHGGVPLTFTQKSVQNPNDPDPDTTGTIADFTINENTSGSSGTIACTVHGSIMSNKFTIC